ncbi:ankyrin repeat domain-containing protein [Sphingobacterium sp. Mn56C]|uniref:ankyrin repeat domain-containing protein n=1 Tax=Sphingobacterium sp. Mn56C TaxID=3395261 RepID=UPI003BBCA116
MKHGNVTRRICGMVFYMLFMVSCSAQGKQEQMKNEIIAAVEKGDLPFIQAHVDGKNVNLRNSKDQTLLMMATYKNNTEMATFLIQAGADPNLQDDIQNSPFLYAAASGYLELVQLFLNHGARFDVFNRYGGTGLIPAAEKGHIDVVRLLCTIKGFPINHVNRLGWTALMEAVVLGTGGEIHTEIVNTLLQAGADPNIPDAQHITALQHAQQRGFTSLVKLLQQADKKDRQ